MRQAGTPRTTRPPWFAEVSRTMEHDQDSAGSASVGATRGPPLAPRGSSREAGRVRSARPASENALARAPDTAQS